MVIMMLTKSARERVQVALTFIRNVVRKRLKYPCREVSGTQGQGQGASSQGNFEVLLALVGGRVLPVSAIA
ncbi:hypothetical protein M0804_006403 [Polistes exclamans]|nr:hypothetical protein M0804_006403 [Polistes exclamans]